MMKRGPKQKPLDARQRAAAFELVWRRGQTKAEVADGLGISRMALWKWEQREDFQALLDKEHKAMVSRRSRWLRRRLWGK